MNFQQVYINQKGKNPSSTLEWLAEGGRYEKGVLQWWNAKSSAEGIHPKDQQDLRMPIPGVDGGDVVGKRLQSTEKQLRCWLWLTAISFDACRRHLWRH